MKKILTATRGARLYALAVVLVVVSHYVPGEYGQSVLPIVAGVLGLPAGEVAAVEAAEATVTKVAPEIAKAATEAVPELAAVVKAAEHVS